MDKHTSAGAPHQRSSRNTPQLFRQVEQEECPPRCRLRATTTQDSQTSSSGGSSGAQTGSSSAKTNATGVSGCTAASWSSSSSDSRSQRATNISSVAAPPVGSSSATSSTEETEAKERRFGSLDLHPLPSQIVATIRAATVRGFPRIPTTISPVPGELGRHSQPSVHLVTTTSCLVVNSNLSACSSSWKTLISDEPSATLPLTVVTSNSSDGNPANRSTAFVLPSDILLPALWPRLLCPVHSDSFISWLKSRLLPADECQKTAPAKEEGMSVAEVPPASLCWTARHAAAQHWPNLEQGAPLPHRIGPYILGHTLGRGNFAVVKLAMHTVTKMMVAVKIMNKHLIGRTSLNKLSRELEAMKRCRHPHIIRLYHVMETKTNIFMITEYASKGEVFDRISMSRAFSENEARELFWQLACAIAFCHQSGVVHRDLKAENLLLDDDFNIKVADFGFCNFFQTDELLSTHCGSPQYAAPELFRGEPYNGPLADVWSLGVILYILVCGSFPFPGESLGDIRIQVLRGLVRFPFFLSTACEQVIRCMLQVDPAKRFKLQEVIKTPWMQASPKVEHYNQLLAKYEARVKQHMFDELFKRQYPKHSQVVQVDQCKRAERALDTGVLSALSLCSGLEEQQVRQSTLLNLCDHHHACYQLLLTKIRRFRRSQPLRLAVNEAIGLAPNQEVGDQVSQRCSSDGAVAHRLGEWEDPEKPDSTDMKVAQFILKADEDSLLGSRGLASGFGNQPLRSGLNESVRRHTVQLTSPMLATLPSVGSGEADDSESTTTDSSTKAADAGAATSTGGSSTGAGRWESQRDAVPRLPYRFPRQTTQPQISTGPWAVACGQPRTRPSSQLRPALEGFPNPWELKTNPTDSGLASQGDSGVCNRSDANVTSNNSRTTTDSSTSKSVTENNNNTSLELGEEAASSSLAPRPSVPFVRSLPPPTARQLRAGFRRNDSILEYEDDGAGGEGLSETQTENMTHICPSVSDMPAVGACSPAADLSFHRAELPFPVAMETDVHDAALAAAVEEEHRLSLSPTRPYQTLGEAVAGATPSSGEAICTGDSAYLPQLNLPAANLPAMMHQPMARFTVKDPHLLAPPEFMTPCCSSFPRRSSDGAADLQPLQRPTITVGGSYPEQANYRDNLEVSPHVSTIAPTATACDPASLLSPAGKVTTTVGVAKDEPTGDLGRSGTGLELGSSTMARRQTPLVSARSHNHHWHHHTSSRFRPNSSCASSVTMARQQRIRTLLAASLRHSRLAACLGNYRPAGTGGPQGVGLTPGDDEQLQQQQQDGLVPVHLKRFSLPVGYRLHLAKCSGTGDSQCICHQPPSPEMWQQLQQRLVPDVETGTRSLPQGGRQTDSSELDTVGDRRGSEASQLLAWNERLSQLYEPAPMPEGSLMSVGPSFVASAAKIALDQHEDPRQSAQPFGCRLTAKPTTATSSTLDGSSASGLPPARSARGTETPQHFQVSTSESIELTDLEKELHYLESEDRHVRCTDMQDQRPDYLAGSGLPLEQAADVLTTSMSSQSTLPPSGRPMLLHSRASDTGLVRVCSVPRRALSVVCSTRGHPVPPLTLQKPQQRRCGQSLGERLDCSDVLMNLDGEEMAPLQPDTQQAPGDCQTGPRDGPLVHRTLTVSLSNPDHRSRTSGTASAPAPTTYRPVKPMSSPRETSPRQRKRSANSTITTTTGTMADGPPLALLHQHRLHHLHQQQRTGDEASSAQSQASCCSSAMLLDRDLVEPSLLSRREENSLQVTGSGEFFTSPKRKVCQEWLLKADAFSKLGPSTGLLPTEDGDAVIGEEMPSCPTSGTPLVSDDGDQVMIMSPTEVEFGQRYRPHCLVSAPTDEEFDGDEAMAEEEEQEQEEEGPSRRFDQPGDGESGSRHEEEKDVVVVVGDSEEQGSAEDEAEKDEEQEEDEEEEGHCYLAPLQSQMPAVFPGGAAALEHHLLLPSGCGGLSVGAPLDNFGAMYPILEDNSSMLCSPPPAQLASGRQVHTSFPAPSSQMVSMLMMLRPQTDDDDDLVEIERVNQRLALSRMARSELSPAGGFFDLRTEKRAGGDPAPQP